MLGDISGKIGNLVFTRNRYGPMIRVRAVPVQARTPARATARGRLAAASALYRQQIYPLGHGPAWIAFAANFPYRGSIGVPGALYLTGQAFSVGINTNRYLLDQAPILEPPGDWGSVIPNPDQTPNSLEVVTIAGTQMLVRMLPTPFDMTKCGYVIRATAPLPGGYANPPVAAFRVIKVAPPSSYLTSDIAVGTTPCAAVVNQATNRIYVVNTGDDTVTEINGFNKSTASIPTGSTPVAIAINTLTNRIYVANSADDTVTWYDNTSKVGGTIAVGVNPCAVAVDMTANKIFVANQDDDTVSEIDGVTHAVTVHNVGTKPVAIAANPATRFVYVSNETSNNVSVIDHISGALVNVDVVNSPAALVVNTITDKAYVAKPAVDRVTEIDGSLLTIRDFAVGTTPSALSINQATNKLYVANQGSDNVTVVTLPAGTLATVAVGVKPVSVLVNQTTNKVYVVNQSSETTTIIDGLTLATSPVVVGSKPVALAVNQSSNKIYVVNQADDDVTEIMAGFPSTTFPDTLDITAEYVAEFGAIPSLGQRFWVQLNIIRLQSLAGADTGYLMLPLQTLGVPVDAVPSPFPVGDNPQGCAVDPRVNRLYTANVGAGTMSVVLLDTGNHVDYGPMPGASLIILGVVNGKVYVASSSAAKIYVFNPANGSVTTVTPTSKVRSWFAHPSTGVVYILDAGNKLYSIDPWTNALTLIGAGGSTASFLSINGTTNHAMISEFDAGYVYDWNLGTGGSSAIVTPQATGDSAWDETGNKCYVCSIATAEVYEYDGVAGTVATIAVANMCTRIRVNSTTQKAYALDPTADTCVEIDCATGVVTPIAVGTTPVALTLDETTNRIWVVCSGSDDCYEIDGATRATTIHAVGNNPADVSHNPTTALTYVTNSDDDTVTEF